MTRDSDGSRGRETRASFSRTSRANSMRSLGEGVSLSKGAKIARAGDETTARVEAHHAKHKERWTNQRYAELLKEGGGTLTLTPAWSSEDPKAALKARASRAVASKRVQRLAQVAKAETNMLKSGDMRKTRRLSWDRGLGE